MALSAFSCESTRSQYQVEREKRGGGGINGSVAKMKTKINKKKCL